VQIHDDVFSRAHHLLDMAGVQITIGSSRRGHVRILLTGDSSAAPGAPATDVATLSPVMADKLAHSLRDCADHSRGTPTAADAWEAARYPIRVGGVLPLQPGAVRLMLIREIDTGTLADAEVFFTGADADRARACLLTGLDGEFRDYPASSTGSETPRTRVSTDVPADSLRALAAMAWDREMQRDHPASLAVTALRNVARYAPPGKRVRLWIEWVQPDPGEVPE
jgi:hypothetical protein